MTIEAKTVLVTGANRGTGPGPMNDYTTSFVVGQSPQEVFEAINNLREWWGPNVEGDNTAVGDEFTYRVPDVHTCKLRVVELVPNEKVVWLVLDNHMSFVADQSEWTGTTVSFEIERKAGHTEVRFAHLGLLPGHECYGVCSNAWGSLMHHSLPSLITTGVGHGYK